MAKKSMIIGRNLNTRVIVHARPMQHTNLTTLDTVLPWLYAEHGSRQPRHRTDFE